jgi:hypothetical protein
MEDKGGFLSKIFRRKKKAPTIEAAPPSQKPITQETPPPSGLEDRKQRQEERNRGQAQDTLAHQVNQAASGAVVESPPGTGPIQAKKASEEIAVKQTLDQAASMQEKFAPKGTPGERFGKLTETQPETELPASPVQQVPIKKKVIPIQTSVQSPSQEVTKPTLSEQKTQELDKATLEKSLQTPPSEWGKTKPATPQEPVKESDSAPPFPPGTFPGVDKWQPGKGAIKGEVLEEVTAKAKEMPKYTSSELEKMTTIDKPAYIPQEKLKKAA